MIGLFGGTFDPVHCGHLRAAHEAWESLQLDQVLLVPCGDPPHRGRPHADGAQRLAWLREAIGDHPGLVADDRELRRNGPSYSVDTLGELRAEYGPERPLLLLLGVDAFLGLPGWHRWQEILEQAHIVVIHRPGATLPNPDSRGSTMERLLAERLCADNDGLQQRNAGCIRFLPITPLSISSSQIRRLLAAGDDPRWLVPDSVHRQIRDATAYRKSQRV